MRNGFLRRGVTLVVLALLSAVGAPALLAEEVDDEAEATEAGRAAAGEVRTRGKPSAAPDLTKATPAKTANSYNLGPTGAQGWMYVEGGMTREHPPGRHGPIFRGGRARELFASIAVGSICARSKGHLLSGGSVTRSVRGGPVSQFGELRYGAARLTMRTTVGDTS
jgi:hypothetical protein